MELAENQERHTISIKFKLGQCWRYLLLSAKTANCNIMKLADNQGSHLILAKCVIGYDRTNRELPYLWLLNILTKRLSNFV